MGVSQHATVPLEDVAAAAPGCARWFQLYILKNRELTADILRRFVHASTSGVPAARINTIAGDLNGNEPKSRSNSS